MISNLVHTEDGYEFWRDEHGTVTVNRIDDDTVILADYPEEPDWRDAVHTFFCTPPYDNP